MGKEIKKQVVVLRQAGKTFREINSELQLNIPKSTLSYWCKYIKLPETYTKKVRKINLNTLEKARKIGKEKIKLIQKSRIEAIIKQNEFLKKHVSKEACKLILSGLYLGQGAKYCNTRCLKIGSSSAVAIKLWLKLLKKCYIIDHNKIRILIMCRADQNIELLERYWQGITKISKTQFYKSRVDKRTIGKKTLKKDYKGVCVIHYFDTNIQLELEVLSGLVEKWV